MSRSKRLFDLLVASTLLTPALPIGAVVALLIKLVEGGPVFFSQERVGLGGRRFRMWKFRTMRVGQPPGLPLTVGNDPRVTRLGGWLRQCRLDELPQLINVLRGEMSLVGPRPEVPEYVERYTPEQRRVLDLVPGITDPASLQYLNEAEVLAKSRDPELTYVTRLMPEKIRMQLEYAQDATVWTDAVVLLNTLPRLWAAARPVLFDRVVRYRRGFIIATQALVVAAALYAAYELRFDFRIPAEELTTFWRILLLLVVIRLAVFAGFGLQRGHWVRFGAEDVLALVKATTVGSLAFAAALFALGPLPGVPRAVLVMEWVGTIFLAGGVRFVARSLRETYPLSQLTGRRTLVIGGGRKVERLLREVRSSDHHRLRILGVVADPPVAQDDSIQGVPVVGGIAELGTVVARLRIDFVVIALDAPTGAEMAAVVERCLEVRVEFKTLPSLQELLEGSARIDQLRAVRVEDLLDREPVRLDLGQIEEDLRGKVVLVTGAAGSIGSELARQVAGFAPARLILVDRAESPLYCLEQELRDAHAGIMLMPVICDVTDTEGVGRLLQRERPAYVLHAAAYKHVPMMEENVFEAVWNNVVGTLAVAEAAVAAGASKFVLISTDKAVQPGSVMGATKRIAERAVLGLRRLQTSETDFRAVRFGNVLASAGSVVPLFEQQLARGGPITVTHPEVERYFMTIPEAAQLVLQAAALSEAAGRIALLEMGEPVRILDLAEKLVRLAGLEPYRDIPIVFTGLRPGEKLHEELVSPLEATLPSGIDKIRVVQGPPESADLEPELAALASSLTSDDLEALLKHVRALVPECVEPLRSRGKTSVRYGSTPEVALGR